MAEPTDDIAAAYAAAMQDRYPLLEPSSQYHLPAEQGHKGHSLVAVIDHIDPDTGEKFFVAYCEDCQEYLNPCLIFTIPIINTH